jgi:uncharacterized membrane protein YeaQ/YmgE (transglycosylase-associated protein family)
MMRFAEGWQVCMGPLVLSSCGLVIGLLVFVCIPRAARMGAGTAAMLGTAGAWTGAFLSCAAANQGISELHLPGVAGALLGSIALLLVTVRVFPRRAAV